MGETTAMTKEEQVSIRTSGLLQAIINSGVPESEWEIKLRAALSLHSRICRILTAPNKETAKHG